MLVVIRKKGVVRCFCSFIGLKLERGRSAGIRHIRKTDLKREVFFQGAISVCLPGVILHDLCAVYVIAPIALAHHRDISFLPLPNHSVI